VPSVGPVKPASLKWGATGKVSLPTINFTVQDCDTYYEKSRKTDTVRVTNPDDSSQYVDVQRTKSLTMKRQKGEGSSAYRPLNATFIDAFAAFDAEVQSAFNDFNINDATTNDGQCTTSFNYNPPA
jgi:hypothetical protein